MKQVLFISALVFAFTLAAPAADKPGQHKRIGVKQFEKLMKEQKLTVLDVRTPDEFEEGHIKGAKNINYYADDFKQQLARLDKSKPYLIHCRSGGRSARAAKIMIGMGFKLVYDLAPGIMGWEEAGKPLVEGKE